MKVGNIRGEGKGVKERNENEEFFRYLGRKRKLFGMQGGEEGRVVVNLSGNRYFMNI